MKKSGNSNRNPGRWHGKAYHFFGDHLWHRFGGRVLKLSIDAGFTCPNRDGTISTEGCLFCGDDGSASPTVRRDSSMEEQMSAARDAFRRADEDTRYIAYFQAFTNTAAPATILRDRYDRALRFPGVVGLMVGTRPDAVPDPVLDLLAEYNRDDFELWLELGMQSRHDHSLTLLGRGHDHETTRDACRRAAARGVPVCAHIILGIPGETWNDMMATAREVSVLPIQGVKIHHLHVIKGTRLAAMHVAGDLELMSLRQYISTLCDFLERLRHDIIIHRLVGDRNEASLIAPAWAQHKGTVLKAIDDEFARRGTFQGFLCEESEEE